MTRGPLNWEVGLVYEPNKLVLEEGVATVRGRLREDLVVSYVKKTERVKVANTDVVPVFDVEKNEWRSFKVDAVQSISLWGDQE